MTKRLKSANGASGCIIHCYNPVTNETFFWFRVYDYKNRAEDGSVPFVDYRIIHNDLFVKIDDKDSAFVEHNGEFYLDHEIEGDEDER